jgi:hypothetical protein
MIHRLSLPAHGSTPLVLPRCELEGFCFPEPPLEYRILRNGRPICDWRDGDSEFHDLQRNNLTAWHERGTSFPYDDPPQLTNHVTFGLSPNGLTVETRGLIGNPSMLIWLRPGSYSEAGSCDSK